MRIDPDGGLAAVPFRRPSGGRDVQKSVHYEIYFRANPKSPWVLMGAREDKDEALQVSEDMAKANPAGASRVSRETLNPVTGLFSGFYIASFGDMSEPVRPPKSKLAPNDAPLCTSVADLYKPQARHAMLELMAKFLNRHKILPLELLHRAKWAEILDNSAFDLQHIVQRAALGRDHGETIHKTVRALNDLATQAINRLFKEQQLGNLQSFPQQNVGAFIARLAAGPDARFRIGGAIANEIANSRQWSDKLESLLDMAQEWQSHRELHGVKEAWAILEDFVAELCEFPLVLERIIDKPRDMSAQAQLLTALAAGDPHNLPAPLDRLAQAFKENRFRTARNVAYRQALRAIKTSKRWFEADLAAEARVTGALAQTFEHVQGPDIPAHEIAEAFLARGRQILAEDRLQLFLSSAQGLDRASKLTDLALGLRNMEQRRRLGHMVVQELDGRNGFTSLDPRSSPFERLERMANLQWKLDSSQLPRDLVNQIHSQIDGIGLDILQREAVLERIAAAPGKPLERAAALLSLAARRRAPVGRTTLLIAQTALVLIASDEGRADLSARPDAGAEIEKLRAAALETLSRKAA